MKMTWRRALLLLLCACVLAWCMLQIRAVGSHLQYVFPAPAPAAGEDEGSPTENGWLSAMQESLAETAEDWQGIVSDWTLDALVETCSFSAGTGSALGGLRLFGEGGQRLHPLYLNAGRLFHPEELRWGGDVILLDETLALALFHIADPLDRSVTVNGRDFRVVGIVRHSRRVGERHDWGAYIPLQTARHMDFKLDVMLLEAVPVPGAGASAAFRSIAGEWQSGGTVIDLGRESMGAWLWLRVLLFLAGMALILRLIRRLNRRAVLFTRAWKRRLLLAYAVRLLPWAAWHVLLFAVAYGALAFSAAVIFTMMLQPVYTFPEWIPPVLVEFSDIVSTFWAVWQPAGTLVEYRTAELMRLRFLLLVTDGFSALAGVLLAGWWGGRRALAEATGSALEAMARQGVRFSRLQAADPLPFEEIGYVRDEDGSLVRVISARQALLALTPAPEDGRLVISLRDAQIPANSTAFLLEQKNGVLRAEETGLDWDMSTDIGTLTQLLLSRDSLDRFLETHTGVDLRVRSAFMNALFNGHRRGG